MNQDVDIIFNKIFTSLKELYLHTQQVAKISVG